METNISYDNSRQCYYVCMDYGRKENGERVKAYKTFDTLPQARRALRQFQAERESEGQVLPNTVSLSQWMEYWMDLVVKPNRAATTIYGYRKILENHLLPALGEIPLQKLSPRHLQRYYTELMEGKGLTANTVRRHHDLLSAALHTAMRQDMIARCPTERVEPPRVIPREARYYNPDTLKQLYLLAEGHGLELVIRLAGSLGLRREEICGLRWESIDFKQRKIYIREARTAAGGDIVQKETKNRSSNRVLHMPEDIFRLLRRERARQAESKLARGERWSESNLVMLNRQGQPLSPNAVSLAFTRFVRKHQLPPITLHGLRHTFATLANAQGVPLFEIGKTLGHSVPTTTGRIYTHLLDEVHTATVDRVAAALK